MSVSVSKHPRILVVALAIASIMTTINVTAFTILLPNYMNEFHTDLLTVQWLSTGYTVAQCMAVLVIGYLADKYSARNVYLAGVIVFALSSFISCFTPNIYALIVMRMLCGAAGGLVSAAGPTIIYQSFDEKKQLQTMSYFTMAGGLGVAFGPAVGGFLEGMIGWRCVYVFNVVSALIIILPLWQHIPRVVQEVKYKLDVLSFLIGASGTFLLLYSLSYGGEWGWFSYKTLGLLFLGIACLAAFICIEWKSDHPILNVHILSNKYFRHGALMYGVAAIALVLSPYVMSFYFQRVWGYSALQAGEAIILPSLAMAIASPISGRIAYRVPSRPIVVVSYAALIFITYKLGQLTPESTLLYIMVWLMLRYVVIGVTDPLIANCAFSLVPQEMMSHASSMNAWIRYMCNALALAVFTGIMNNKLVEYTALGQSAESAMCNALNDLTIYSMWVVVLCIPIALMLKDKLSLDRERTTAGRKR
ncbi:MAG: hypothetical protein DBX41_01750 [Clostridiales bacterium]|nr:MAG: hypothetical protein DBX41_01750 [Clostridiales bacterium]